MGAVTLRVAGGYQTYHRGTRELAVFRDLDLEVRDGEILALLGPSGCGKSTLLRVMAGLEPLRGGDVSLDGGPVDRARVGIAFQQPHLYPWLSVADNVALGLRFAANAAARAAEPVDDLLREFGLEQVADAYPDELSGGQAQRAGLARTLAVQPRVVLLDEPFAALDPRTRGALCDWLLELQRRRGLTVVLVTHDVGEALRVGDRVALMTAAPGTIARVWDARALGGADRETPAAGRVRREIVSLYGSTAGPAAWVAS